MNTRTASVILCLVVLCCPASSVAAKDSLDVSDWRPAAQRDLAKQLADAPELSVEDVLAGPTRVWMEHPVFVPNPDGSWDMIVVYQENYMGAKQAVVHDFGAGQTTTQDLCTDDAGDPLTEFRYTFHLRPHYWAAGKLFVDVGPPSKGVTVLAYDPKENRFVHISRPFGQSVARAATALGADGMLYGIGWANDTRRLVPYRIDPESYEVQRYGGFGPANENWTELYIDCVMDDQWLYAGIGQAPWYLVAYNFKTREGRILARSKDIKEDKIRLRSLRGGAEGRIKDAVWIKGIDGTFASDWFDFWIRDGEVYKKTGEVPPWSDRPAELRERQYEWDHNCWYMGDQAHWGDFVPEPGPPEVDAETLRPDSEGMVAATYEIDGEDRDRTLRFKVRRYPGKVRRMMAIDEYRIFAADEGYGQVVIFDLGENRVHRIGDMSDLSPYSMTLLNEKLYLCGYPSSRLYELDLSRPFTLEGNGGGEQGPNPKLVSVLAEYSDTHSPFAGTVVGGDGRIYAAGSTYGRRRDGGGMGWYDPKTDESGGIWEPFTPYRVFWKIGRASCRERVCHRV